MNISDTLLKVSQCHQSLLKFTLISTWNTPILLQFVQALLIHGRPYFRPASFQHFITKLGSNALCKRTCNSHCEIYFCYGISETAQSYNISGVRTQSSWIRTTFIGCGKVMTPKIIKITNFRRTLCNGYSISMRLIFVGCRAFFPLDSLGSTLPSLIPSFVNMCEIKAVA